MKKIFRRVAAIVLCGAVLFSGCSSATKTDSSKKSEGSETSSKVEKIKVGFIYVGPVGDGGFTYSHDQGRKYLVDKLGVETVIKESVKEDKAEVQKTAQTMIDEGCNVIIGTSFGFQEGLLAAAKDNPEVKFMHCSGFETADNLTQYFGRIHDMMYLNGIVAGMKTKSNKIGFVGAMPIPEVIRNIDAFTLGVQSVNKDAKVDVVWTNTWYDPAKEKDAAMALIAKGADVIAQHQDTAGPQQAAEEKGVFSIGYNTDMSKTAPKANLSSALWNWGPYYVEQIKAIQDGTWKSQKYWGGASDGIVDIALSSLVTDDIKAKVEEAKKAINSGELKVFAGPIKDQSGAEKVKQGEAMSDEDIWNINWFVQGVEGSIPNDK